MELKVVSDNTENVKVFGDIESSVEFIRSRLHENFTVFILGGNENKAVAERMSEELYNALRNVNRVEIR